MIVFNLPFLEREQDKRRVRFLPKYRETHTMSKSKQSEELEEVFKIFKIFICSRGLRWQQQMVLKPILCSICDICDISKIRDFRISGDTRISGYQDISGSADILISYEQISVCCLETGDPEQRSGCVIYIEL